MPADAVHEEAGAALRTGANVPFPAAATVHPCGHSPLPCPYVLPPHDKAGAEKT